MSATVSPPAGLAPPPLPPAVFTFAWMALILGVLGCLGDVLSHRPLALVAPAIVASFGPSDLTAWVDAICGAVGKIGGTLGPASTAISLTLLGWHKLAIRVRAWKEARQHRRRRPRRPGPPAAA